MSSKSAGKLKDELLGQIGEQIKALQLGQQTVAGDNEKEGYVVTGKNIHLQCLLDLLDHILLLGLHEVEFGYWPFVSKFTHSETIRLIVEHPQVTNDYDKGRVWVFMATGDGLWESYIRAFTSGQKVAKKFYTRQSMIRDKERLSVLLTLVSGLDFINITLDQFSPYLGYGTYNPHSLPEFSPRLTKTDDLIITPNRSRKISTSTTSSFSNASTITAPTSPTSPTSSEYDSSDTVSCADDVTSPKIVPSSNNTHWLSREQEIDFEHETQDSEKENKAKEDELSIDKDGASLKHQINIRDSATNVMYFNEPGFLDKDHDYVNHRKGFKEDFVMMEEVDIVYCHHQRKGKKTSKKTNLNVKDFPSNDTDNDEKVKSEEKVIREDADDVLDQDENLDNRPGAETARRDSLTSSHSVGPECHHVGSPGSLDSSYASGDSMDQFCRDIDTTSLNDNSVDEASVQVCQNELAASQELLVDFPTVKTLSLTASLEEDDCDVPSKLQTSAEYEGIILGLPKRPIISEMNCSSADFGVDQNTLLLLTLEVFQKNGEQLLRFLRLRTGHRGGVPRTVFVAVTNQAIYIMRRVPSHLGLKFKTEHIFPVSNTTKIEIGINFQTVGFSTKASKCVLTIGDEAVARSLMSTITTALLKSNLPSPLSGILSDSHIQQETRIKEWVKETDENMAPITEIVCFSLVHWSCLAGPDSLLELMSFQSLKEGYLDYKGHNVLGLTTRWIQGYFVLTNGNLYQYNKQGDSHAKLVLNLKNSRCGGCRRLSDPERPFAFEIVSFSGSPLLILATESEHEASDWIYRLCQTIADSFESKEEMGCHVTRCIPCCVVATKTKVVTFLEDESDRYRLLSTCPVQGISKLYIDNEYRNYCILKFDYGDIADVESTWFLWFKTEYELCKFERAVAGSWKELFQVDLQFLVLGDSTLRKKARDLVESVETMFRG